MQDKNNNKKSCPAKLQRSGGFTIIETMIAVALFLIIIMAGMGALLNASLIHDKSQDQRSIMDNLSFIMEDMSRNIRTGYDYQSNFAGEISFKHIDNGTEELWNYIIYADGNIKKSIDSEPGVQLNPNEVKFEPGSGFVVIGAESPPDVQQPFVIIRLVGAITSLKSGVVTPFSLQTSVSQRLIDI